jgi:hypothetical protein
VASLQLQLNGLLTRLSRLEDALDDLRRQTQAATSAAPVPETPIAVTTVQPPQAAEPQPRATRRRADFGAEAPASVPAAAGGTAGTRWAVWAGGLSLAPRRPATGALRSSRASSGRCVGRSAPLLACDWPGDGSAAASANCRRDDPRRARAERPSLPPAGERLRHRLCRAAPSTISSARRGLSFSSASSVWPPCWRRPAGPALAGLGLAGSSGADARSPRPTLAGRSIPGSMRSHALARRAAGCGLQLRW